MNIYYYYYYFTAGRQAICESSQDLIIGITVGESNER